MRRIRVEPRRPAEEALREAVGVLRGGGVVAYPTETFYGLGVDALDGDACRRVFAIKQRSTGNPLPWIVADLAQLETVAQVNDVARLLASHFWPGPLTLILPASDGKSTVAARVSSLPLARSLAERFGGPITSTSANRAGDPAAATADQVSECLRGIDLLLDGGPCAGGYPSTLVDVSAGERPILVRPGAIAFAEVVRLLEESPSVG